jgi:hypothetical protein
MFAGLYAHEETEKLQDDELHATKADSADTNDNTEHGTGSSGTSSHTDGNQAAEAYGK